MAAKNKKGMAGTVIFVILLAAVLIGAFVLLTKKTNESKLEAEVTVSEAEEILDRNLDGSDYPVTPREVLKMYGRIVKCLYNEDVSERETEKLIAQLRKLYSDELLFINPEDEMVTLSAGEINSFRKAGNKIYSYTVDSADTIQYITDSEGERAVLNMYFMIKEGSDFERSYESFVLEKNENGRWKILGWKRTE